MCKYLQTIRLSKRIPLQTCLCLPAGHETSFLEDSVCFINTRCLIRSLDKGIPFRAELISILRDSKRIRSNFFAR